MDDRDVAFMPAFELSALISSKQISPVELTEVYLRRIDKFDSSLNAYLTVDTEGVVEAAKEAEQAVIKKERLGPLHGIPISIKDLELTKGIRTTSGSLVYKDRVPE